jgi:hypothetical protein
MGEWKGPEDAINRDGRKKGSMNRYTKQVKEAFGLLLEGNLENLSIWLAQVAADDPKAALDIMMRMSERFVPKLKQTEITGADGEDLFKNVRFDFGPPVDDDQREDE